MPNQESKYKRKVGIYVNKELLVRFKSVAAKHRRNLGQEFEHIFEEWLELQNSPTGPPPHSEHQIEGVNRDPAGGQAKGRGKKRQS
jgi:hypothetical protein